MTSPADNTALAALQAEQHAFREFSATLKAEQKALIADDIAGLTSLSALKQKQVEQLNELAAERLERIAALGFSGDRAGMEQWAQYNGSAALEAWHALLAVAELAHHANQVNGSLIQSRMQHNKQMLSALLAASSHTSLYGPDGQRANSAGTGGIIGKA